MQIHSAGCGQTKVKHMHVLLLTTAALAGRVGAWHFTGAAAEAGTAHAGMPSQAAVVRGCYDQDCRTCRLQTPCNTTQHPQAL
jgi:hypothetical protein